MSPPIEISFATEADLSTLSQLLAELFSQEAEFQVNTSLQMQGLSLILTNPAIGHIFVAKQDLQVVGMVILLYTVSTALGERVAWLEDMVVTDKVRGRGVGAMLLQHALSYARHNGCRRITLLTDQDNRVAQQFYARQGFSASDMMPMRLLL